MKQRGDRAALLDPYEWNDRLDRLAKLFDTRSEAVPTRRLSRLEETDDAFVVSAVLGQGRDEITTASIVWPKATFVG